MLCTIYQALVLNVVAETDERGDEASGDELDIDTEKRSIARFATLNTKRFFRSLLYKFDIVFRELLKSNINAGKLVTKDSTPCNIHQRGATDHLRRHSHAKPH